MAYNTKPIVTDVDGNPISQYYNPETDQYEPVEGQAGANKVVLYNADGTENNSLSLIPILEKLSELTGTVIDEQTRQSNEQQRITFYNQLVEMLNTGQLKGDKGDTGETGQGLEFDWDGTRLGVRVEGDEEYIYVDLRGPQGPPGEIENLTMQHVINALGYTPIKSVNNILADEGGNVELDIDTSEIENRIGNVEEDLDTHKADYADLKGYIGYTEDDIYGVEADFVNKKFTRLAGAVNKNPGADFDSINAFGGRKRCILTDDGVVLAYYGEPGYSETGKTTVEIEKDSVTYPVGTIVQVMVEQPKFYYKVVPLKLEKIQDGIGYHLRKARYYVSDTPKVGFKVHPAFVRNGVEVDKIYLSAYEGSIYDESAGTYLLADEQIADFNADKLSSIAYAKPASGLTQNLTRANTRKLAENRGAGWQISDVLSVSVTQILFIIEYASFNTQANIGLGVVNKPLGEGNESELTGATSNLGNASGMAVGTNGLVSISYRGEENFWGNIWKWMDGLNIEAKGIHQAYWADSGFADNVKTSPYKNCGFTLAKTNGYVSAFGYSEDCDFLFLPSEVIGASNLPVGDYFYQNHNYNGFLVAPLGGFWYSGSYAGAFCWYVTNASSIHGRSIGSRLLYVPQ